MQRKTKMMEDQIHLLFSFSFFFSRVDSFLLLLPLTFVRQFLYICRENSNEGNGTSLYDSSRHTSDFDCTTMNHAAFTAKA